MSGERTFEPPNVTQDTASSPNIVGWAGLGFAAIAAGLYGVLFFMLHQLPSSLGELEQLQTNAPVLTRLLVVAASAALLNVVGLTLCLAEFLAPRRPRALAVIGTLFSAIMLIGVFSVVIVSLMIAPRL